MPEQVFVGREGELARLHTFMDRVVAGQSQVCFVTGEAGRGKTALTIEFARQAQEKHKRLIVALGQGDAQTGMGDAYLPFREILGLLTGDVEGKLAQGSITQENANRLQEFLRFTGQVLIELGPDLLDLFFPFAGWLGKLGAFAADRAGLKKKLETPGKKGLEQSQIFEQYTNVLMALAEKQPLLLILDDLQWADTASIGLLFRLGRRIQQSRIMIVGTYRPDEIALGRAGERHPLEKVLAEFKRYFGDISVDLDQVEQQESRQFVDSFLDTEPNRLDESFRQALYRHTGGHPLFTIELLREMQRRGDLVRDEEGRWVQGPVLDWATLPVRVEGVVEERIGRLEQELRDILNVASICGRDFYAEVVAQIRGGEARSLVRRLSTELEDQHRLISAQGTRRLGPQRLSLYRFQHQIFQSYLYNAQNEAERTYLHEDVGYLLEELYGEQVEEIVVQLAWHFSEAELVDKALDYLTKAGQQAAARFAHQEALSYFDRALEWTPETEHGERLQLLLARASVHEMQGDREAQQRDLEQAQELSAHLDDPALPAELALHGANYAELTGAYGQAIESAREAIRLAKAAGRPKLEALGYLRWGRALWHLGHYEIARLWLERGLERSRVAQQRELEADSLRNLGVDCWYMGLYNEARAYSEQALAIYREMDERRGESGALNDLGLIAQYQGDMERAREYHEQALQIRRETGDRRGQAISLHDLGDVALHRGDCDRAQGYYEQALQIHREIEDRCGETMSLQDHGDLSFYQGDFAQAHRYYERALEICREIGERRDESRVLATLGRLLQQEGENERARQHSEQAVEIARDIGDRPSLGHALTSLGHALTALGELEQAAAAYQQVLDIRRLLGQGALAIESLAGLARVAQEQGKLEQAAAYVQEILDYLAERPLFGVYDAARIQLTCYQVLLAKGEPWARETLAAAHRSLQERAGKIQDPGRRRSFLENVPAHAEIISEWEGGGGGK
ncbi:MAG: tetratricopeptide repeat protein [Chloroflexia bacterium]|nr:tetratricopeptide repeat protein [Chloroflexia bacterium]